ncbi:related to low affininty zinc transporter [Phialocephala subalpina]|uniref:Related to low affininty zinc transporter n=1 Tax=Phialocephala subalpina TaxID=576137 RepID=A0A1L7XU22_9HELO|nr:related to low affininty zinc transporter [Phialocephala subalpina]
MAEEMTSTKPQCGGGGAKQDDYDLPLHVAALFLVLLKSIGGAGFPVVAKRVSWLKIPPKIFFFCKHFGTGVLIATAFVHLIPTAFQSLNDPCLPDLLTVQYPAMPGSKTGGHSHGDPTGEGLSGQGTPPGISVLPRDRGRPTMRDDIYPDEKDAAFARDDEVDSRPVTPSDIDLYGLPSEMPPWFQSESGQLYVDPDQNTVPAESYIDEATFKKMSLNITLLEGGILFHSVFVGMTISITTDGFIILLIAILFHQFFEGLGLGSRIAAVPYPKGAARPWILVVAFGTTAPIGQAIGLIARNSYDPQSAFALIIVGVFNAISSGLLIYAATVDLLAEDFFV